jgi:PAS domain-containing protein
MSQAVADRTKEQLIAENEELRARLVKAERALRVTSSGDADALVVAGAGDEQASTIKGADQIYRMLVEGMNEGALILSTDHVILFANRCFSEMVKTPLTQLIGSIIDVWIVSDNHRLLETLLVEIRNTAKS